LTMTIQLGCLKNKKRKRGKRMPGKRKEVWRRSPVSDGTWIPKLMDRKAGARGRSKDRKAGERGRSKGQEQEGGVRTGRQEREGRVRTGRE
jgi:hypothetical protein